jgi:hypothetical protein
MKGDEMRITSSAGSILLSIWLILNGLIAFGVSFPNEGVLLSLLAIIAGILILLGR